MRPRFLFLTIGLVATLSVTVASCAPAPAAPAVDSAPPAAAPTEASALQPTAAVPAEATEAPAQAAEVLPVPTSRGPKLEATDPATVSLASGQLQLVEFFRFT